MQKVSIVTPSYNQGCYIKQCIDSVRNQTYRPIQHIVVDNCSTDKTSAILSEYRNSPNGIEVDLIIEPDTGQSEALNKGFKTARGSIIGWLNADDYYNNCIVEEALKDFSIYSSFDVIYYDYFIIDNAGRIVKQQVETRFDLNILKYYGCNIPTTTMFFRRTVFDDGLFLNTRLHYSMDSEYFIRLAQSGYSFKHVNKALAFFRKHDDAKSVKDQHRQKSEGYLIRRQLCFSKSGEGMAMMKFRFLNRIFYIKRLYLKALATILYYYDRHL